MIKKYIKILLLILITLSQTVTSHAFWVWTPETNKWVNPKYSVKDTPSQQLAYAIEFFQAKGYEDAIKECRKLIKHYPKAMEAPESGAGWRMAGLPGGMN